MNNYLRPTPLLNFSDPEIKQLVLNQGWGKLTVYDKIGAIYNYVQNDITFGYNQSDEIPATAVLKDGYGQCNTKGTLLMALLRAVDIPCRFHGFTIEKKLQKGAITGIPYQLAPKSIVHSWVEVLYQDQWLNLEGFILDKKYLQNVQKNFPEVEGEFNGYGIATSDFRNPEVDWKGTHTYIQKNGVNHDFGVFDDPDSFYQKNGSNLKGFKAFIYKKLIRKMINANVSRIRAQK